MSKDYIQDVSSNGTWAVVCRYGLIAGDSEHDPIGLQLQNCFRVRAPQKENLNESWINLGLPTTDVIGAKPAAGIPGAGVATTAEAGFANEG
jgi:hypothetical protein